MAAQVAQLPVKERDEDQQDEDEEQRAHSDADDHRGSVRSCEVGEENEELFSQGFVAKKECEKYI